MSSFLFKLKSFLTNMLLVLTVIWSVMAVLAPNTKLFSKIFWVALAVTLAIIRPLFRKLKQGRKHNGYVVIQGTNEYAHRGIARRILKRKLLPNEVVHHINGRRSDNRLINLCVMDRHQHELFHAWLDWKKKKTGHYPNITEQKRLLSEKHNGLILDTYTPSVRYVERSEELSRKLFSELRQERSRLAHENNIPVYLVFKNFTLTEMAQKVPEDEQAMKNIIGVTPEKFRLYGNNFLAVIWKHKKDSESFKSRKSV